MWRTRRPWPLQSEPLALIEHTVELPLSTPLALRRRAVVVPGVAHLRISIALDTKLLQVDGWASGCVGGLVGGKCDINYMINRLFGDYVM